MTILYTQSTRNGGIVFCKYEGQDTATVLNNMAQIGHTDITLIDETAYLLATQPK